MTNHQLWTLIMALFAARFTGQDAAGIVFLVLVGCRLAGWL